MKLSGREKITVMLGAGVVCAIVLIAAIITPLARRWSGIGGQLAPKLESVKELTLRAQKRNALLGRRSHFVGELGALIGAEASPKAKSASSNPGTKSPRTEPAADRKSTPPGALQLATGSHLPSPPDKNQTPTGNNPDQNSLKPATGSAEARSAPPETPPKPPASAKSSAAVSFATYLERTAKAAKVKPQRIQPRKQPKSAEQMKYYQPVALQIKFSCNLQSLLKLLHGLEKGPRLARVEHIDLRRDLKKGGNLEVTLDVIGYESKAR
jgi:hypothetical protein